MLFFESVKAGKKNYNIKYIFLLYLFIVNLLITSNFNLLFYFYKHILTMNIKFN